ncbi:hypothetical protein [Pseudohaliea sp.]|uniref:hypothetical protein n=1 Tax=Pseudohaliea sp. TaxID=2740289 RepID=UPI0032ECD619
MKRLGLPLFLWALGSAGGLPLAAAEAVLPEVDCDVLAAWAAEFDPGETFAPRPGLEVNALFSDERLLPLFGSPVVEWQRDHFRDLGAMMNTCRRELYARDDRPAGDALYAVMKASRDVTSAMQQLWTAQTRVERQVDKLLELEPSPELAGVFAMAADALQGIDVSDRVRDQERRYQGLARQVAQLSEYAPLLAPAEVAAYRARLEGTRAAAAEALAAENAAFQATLRAIADAPLNAEGYAQLKQISYNTDRSALTRQQLAAFNSAMQQKTQAIREVQAAEQARAEAEAARPIDLGPHLQDLVSGNGIKRLAIAGLAPEMAQAAAMDQVQRGLGLARAANPIDSAQFAVPRENAAQYLAERRTGPRVSLDLMDDGRVGQVTYEEFFRARVVTQSARQLLTQALGEPDAVRAEDDDLRMRWHDGGRRLQVRVTNTLETVWRGAGYEGRLIAALWHRDYEDHLDTVNERCAAIRETPRGDWSTDDSRFFAAECPMMPGSTRTPGLRQ